MLCRFRKLGVFREDNDAEVHIFCVNSAFGREYLAYRKLRVIKDYGLDGGVIEKTISLNYLTNKQKGVEKIVTHMRFYNTNKESVIIVTVGAL